jgi:hypothetical protein
MPTSHYADQDFVDYGILRSVENAMIEYAEWYAKKCLNLANPLCVANSSVSILEIELPKHDE